LTARADLLHSDRPACRALREKRPIVCNDLTTETSLAALSEEAKAGGLQSLAALPLTTDGRVDAVIVLLAGERDFFDSQEMELLEELAADISFALDYLVKQERLNYVSLHDPLTGLANREMFFDRLKQLIEAMRDAGRPLGVIVIDLQRFRLINDTLGRGAGDKLLKTFASRLEGIFGVAPTLARIGGDRFAVAMGGLSSSTLAHRIEKRILGGLAYPFRIEGEELRVACKIGVAMFPDDAQEAEALFAMRRPRCSARRKPPTRTRSTHRR
jgi:diguanylate cyclase (GGDEF)-like protein